MNNTCIVLVVDVGKGRRAARNKITFSKEMMTARRHKPVSRAHNIPIKKLRQRFWRLSYSMTPSTSTIAVLSQDSCSLHPLLIIAAKTIEDNVQAAGSHGDVENPAANHHPSDTLHESHGYFESLTILISRRQGVHLLKPQQADEAVQKAA